MNVMIFAAGLGTRLRPLTDHCPKALVEVDHKPMLQHLIEKLKAAGFDHIVVNVHHFGEQIISFLEANNHFGVHIDVSDERGLLLDTGGGIKKAAPLFADGEPILIHNVDIFSDLNLRSFYDAHRSRSAKTQVAASLVVNRRQTSRYLLFDHRNLLRGWINESTGAVKSPLLPNFDAAAYEKKAFAGIHIIEPALLPAMQPMGDVFSIIDFYLTVCGTQNLCAFDAPTTMQWVDAGKMEALPLAEKIVRQGRVR